jgi:aminopeptidase N
VVEGAAGLPAPDYVWPNDGDYGYGLFFPDDRSAAWIAEHVGEARDGLLRAMLWGALWDLVRDTACRPRASPRSPCASCRASATSRSPR